MEKSVKPTPPTHVSHKVMVPRTIAVMMRVCRFDIETFRRNDTYIALVWLIRNSHH